MTVKKIITRPHKGEYSLGIHYQRYSGEPSILDPLGQMRGWSLVIKLFFLNFGFRAIHA